MPRFPGLALPSGVFLHFHLCTSPTRTNDPLNSGPDSQLAPRSQTVRTPKMLTSGLTNTPLTKILIIYIIASSIALSILDVKHLASIHVSPHFWPYMQLWRAFAWQPAGFANSTEALFGAMLVYHLRVIERAWGKRKMAVSSPTAF